ncbi:MAG: DUF1858 domain-containing protein [bacterium]|nr:DUF1858 domain-containing protein [bacterium]
MPIKKGKIPTGSRGSSTQSVGTKVIKVVTKKSRKTGSTLGGKPSVKRKTNKSVVKNQQEIITKDMLMGELVSKYPQTSEVLMKNGLHCIGCMLSPYESLESGVAVHGIPIKPLLKELNQVINKPIKTKK